METEAASVTLEELAASIDEAEQVLFDVHGQREGSIFLCKEGFGQRTLVTGLTYRNGKLFVEAAWEGSIRASEVPLLSAPSVVLLLAAKALPRLHDHLRRAA